MSYEEKKLEIFKKTIINDAKEKAKKLIDAAILNETEYLNKIEKEAREKESKDIEQKMNEIKAKYDYEVTKKNFEIKREILDYRNSLKEEVLKMCKENINNFTKSFEYKEYLIEKIKKNLKSEKTDQIIIEIREKDYFLESEIKSVSSLIEIKINRKIELGGFKLTDFKNKIEIDETFDCALKIIMKDFYKTTNLNIKNF